jgi:hypothetical protein
MTLGMTPLGKIEDVFGSTQAIQKWDCYLLFGFCKLNPRMSWREIVKQDFTPNEE